MRLCIYVSGPMAGIESFNYPAFNAIAAELRARGFDVLNPAESFDGDATLPRKHYMRLDFEHVLNADALVVLNGWQASRGANVEVAMARELELPVYAADDFLTSATPTPLFPNDAP